MKTSFRVYLHIAFWVLITVLPQFFYAFLRHPNDITRIYMYLVDFGINLVCFYVAYFLFIPNFLKSSKKWLWALWAFIFALGYGIISSNIILSVAEILEIHFFKKFTPLTHHFREFVGTLLFITYAIFIRLTENWIVDQRLKNELIQQNQAGELALLKSQVSPHFLFNTLNNIYSLVYQKSDNAPSAVMKLSEIMRYMLYEASTEKVMLERELNYLNSYIELQSIRMKQKNFIQFEVDGQPGNKRIAPMLLIPFVENAFKHCDKKSDPPGIRLRLQIDENKIEFEIWNRISKDKKAGDSMEGGIGLSNVKRRLELLYRGVHELVIDETDTEYTVNLTIFEV